MNFCDNGDSELKALLDTVKTERRLGIHSFHRYYGKLIPAIPRAAIRRFTETGDLVFDPFVGSGTTAVEAIYADRAFAGIEINPLSASIARTKTYPYDVEQLKAAAKRLLDLVAADDKEVGENEKPFCVNREHWFKDFVQKDLVRISRNIPAATEFIGLSERKAYSDFFFCVLSAIVKQVSNADVRHVFPGVSKRMRRLEEEGLVAVDVKTVFSRALKKRIGYVEEFGAHASKADIMNGDSASQDLGKYRDSVDLVVTNPPYISSVRYAETLKLELFWMGICRSSREYAALSSAMIGNDRILRADYEEKRLMKYPFVNEYIDLLYQTDKKQAKVVYDYFTAMEKVVANMRLILKPNKKLVMKIADSKIRKIAVPTGKLLSLIAEENGFSLVDVFDDAINEFSRSLLTARNVYSDIILKDNVVVWEKK